MTKAKFVTEGGKKTIPLHFNPAEYSIITANTPTHQENPAGSYLSSLKNEKLSMQLLFDTYTNYEGQWGKKFSMPEREDVRIYTDPIVNLASGDRKLVSFEWGSLNFKGVVISVSQKFTMFMDDGKPVRAVLDVVMQGSDINEIAPAAQSQSINWADNSWKDKVQVAKARQLLDKKN